MKEDTINTDLDIAQMQNLYQERQNTVVRDINQMARNHDTNTGRDVQRDVQSDIQTDKRKQTENR